MALLSESGEVPLIRRHKTRPVNGRSAVRNPLRKIESPLLRVLLALTLDILVFAFSLAFSANWNDISLTASMIFGFLCLAVIGFFVSPTMAVAEAIGSRPMLLFSLIGYLIAIVAFIVQIKSRRLLPCCVAFLIYVLFAYFSFKMLEKSIGPGLEEDDNAYIINEEKNASPGVEVSED